MAQKRAKQSVKPDRHTAVWPCHTDTWPLSMHCPPPTSHLLSTTTVVTLIPHLFQPSSSLAVLLALTAADQRTSTGAAADRCFTSLTTSAQIGDRLCSSTVTLASWSSAPHAGSTPSTVTAPTLRVPATSVARRMPTILTCPPSLPADGHLRRSGPPGQWPCPRQHRRGCRSRAAGCTSSRRNSQPRQGESNSSPPPARVERSPAQAPPIHEARLQRPLPSMPPAVPTPSPPSAFG